MAEIGLLGPKLKLNINLEIRLRVLAQIIDEMTKICGAEITEDLQKGVIKRDIIEKVILTFVNEENKGKGRIIFSINWDKLEILAETDDEDELYADIDFSDNISQKLDSRMIEFIKMHVNKLKNEYQIKRVICSFRYREKYRTQQDVLEATRKYMNHSKAVKLEMEQNEEFKNSIQAAFKGVDGTLDVIFEY